MQESRAWVVGTAGRARGASAARRPTGAQDMNTQPSRLAKLCKLIQLALAAQTHSPNTTQTDTTQNNPLLRNKLNTNTNLHTYAAIAAAAIPTPLVLVTFVGIKSVWAATLGVELSWILLPMAIMLTFPVAKTNFKNALRHASQRHARQAAVGLALCLVTVGSFLILLVILQATLSDEVQARLKHIRVEAATYGFSSSDYTMVGVFSGWFILVNPTLEELFWRIFIFDSISRLTCAKTREGAIGVMLATSALYASYHSSVLFVFFDAPTASLALLGLVGYGMFLQILTSRIGVFAAIGAHTGGDAVVLIGLWLSIRPPG